jgi:hypothetical protein
MGQSRLGLEGGHAVSQEDKSLKETAQVAEELINRALSLDPKNALALHLHIHISEASSPQRCPTD